MCAPAAATAAAATVGGRRWRRQHCSGSGSGRGSSVARAEASAFAIASGHRKRQRSQSDHPFVGVVGIGAGCDGSQVETIQPARQRSHHNPITGFDSGRSKGRSSGSLPIPTTPPSNSDGRQRSHHNPITGSDSGRSKVGSSGSLPIPAPPSNSNGGSGHLHWYAPSDDAGCNSSGAGDGTRFLSGAALSTGHEPRLPDTPHDSRGLLSDTNKTIVTPFRFTAWKRLLNGHPDHALHSRVLIGIARGIDVQYRGPRDVQRHYVRNLTTAMEHAAAVATDLADEVKAGRRAGPFDVPPLDHFIASPLGVVAKPGSDKLRVIHHLSYPFDGESVNKYVVELTCTLSSFDDAARMVVSNGRGSLMSKIDVKAAYRCIPMRPSDWGLTGILWDGKYYFDKNLGFGMGSSCALWEDFALGLEWIVKRHAAIETILHYIDDCFVSCRPHLEFAKGQLKLILAIYDYLGVPVSLPKLKGPVTEIDYLGIVINSESMTARLSEERVAAICTALEQWVTRPSCAVVDLQSLIGTLSFAAKVVRPGRIFLRRMLDLLAATENCSSSRFIKLNAGSGPTSDGGDST